MEHHLYSSKLKTEHWKLLSRFNIYEFRTKNGQVHISDIISDLNIKTVLDYGCGYGHSLDYVKSKVNVTNYDPFVPQYSDKPKHTSELTVCYNVLNIIEDEILDSVILDIHSLTEKYLIFNIKIVNSIKNDNFFLSKFYEKPNLFKVIDYHYSETLLYKTKTDNLTKEVYESKNEIQKDLYILLEVYHKNA